MNGKKQKILCVCQGGNSRSVHLAYLLKDRYRFDALACGWEGNAEDTLMYLCKWAEVIIVVQPMFVEKISEKFREKVIVMDCGEDRYFNPNLELLDIFGKLISEHVVQVTNAKASTT